MQKTNKTREFLQGLQNPESQHRPLPFWSWNDKLEPQEMRRQIELMHKSGVGGFFMHARAGLPKGYLGQTWFDDVQLCTKEGRQKGMHPWIYDEEGWPSGFAGGKVTALGQKTYARGLRMRRIASQQDVRKDGNLLGVFACEENDVRVVPVQQMQAGNTYVEYVEMYQTQSPHYIDVLNADVVKEFLDVTHESYAARMEVGDGGLQGFFTDEPRMSEGAVPWSLILPKAFEERYGYSLMPLLPALYLPCEGASKLRYDFWKLVNELFTTAYMKQIYNWCEQHNCQLTGHAMMEESIYSQMTGSGGNMPLYEYMHQPGVDSLRRRVGDPRVPKQVGSVAEQLGNAKVLTESYAMSGWNISFEEMGWIAGWQYVNGVNLMCQHLQAYSLKGARKRDYPPSLSYQQSWYDEYEHFNTYLGRLGKLLTEGDKQVQVLLLHPMHSGWVSYDGENNNEIAGLDNDFVDACDLLSGQHIEYHLGDETILARHGSVEADGCLCVGEMRYKAVVLPSMLVIDETTLHLLELFVAAGGRIIALGSLPKLCEGIPSQRLEILAKNVVKVAKAEKVKGLLEEYINVPVNIGCEGQEAQNIHCRQLRFQQGRVLYVVNTSHDEGAKAVVKVLGNWCVQILDLVTLAAAPVQAELAQGSTSFMWDVLPMQNLVFLLTDEIAEEKTPSPKMLVTENSPWHIVQMGDNLLTLDACEYRVDGSDWHPKTAVIHLMQKLLDRRCACEIEQRFVFTLGMPVNKLKRMKLVIEQPEQFSILLNGRTVPILPEGWYKDISFIKLDILPFLVQGENVLELHSRFYQQPHVYEALYGENVFETELNKLTYDVELESMYLLGDFGVYSEGEFEECERDSLVTTGGFVLNELPKTLEAGDFTTQGLLFFADKLRVAKLFSCNIQKGHRVFLDVGKPDSPMVKVFVNGKPVTTLLWAPWVCDITEFVAEGENELMLELYASNRNMLGPHHHARGELFSVGPSSFEGSFSWADRESEAVVITPDMRKQNFWTNKWCFTRFGI